MNFRPLHYMSMCAYEFVVINQSELFATFLRLLQVAALGGRWQQHVNKYAVTKIKSKELGTKSFSPCFGCEPACLSELNKNTWRVLFSHAQAN